MNRQRLLAYFRKRQKAFGQMMIGLINHPSGSGEVENVNRLLSHLEKLFAPFNTEVMRIKGPGGDILSFTTLPKKKSRIVFLAHVDTVNIGKKRPLARMMGNRLYGNGSFDMKNGIALFYFVLEALKKFKLRCNHGIRLIFTPDEETGSSTSLPHLFRLSRNARAVLLPEPCGPDGAVKVRRKAVVEIKADLKGRPAHSGLAPQKGRDANRALGLLIARIQEALKPFRDVTFNPGLISGGIGTNTVSPASCLQGEIRAFSNGRLHTALKKIKKIRSIQGVKIGWQSNLCHPALEFTPANRSLYQTARRIMRALNYDLPSCSSGGGSDGSSLAARHIPVLDGIGLKGDHAHSENEYIEIDDFPFRATLLTALAMDL